MADIILNAYYLIQNSVTVNLIALSPRAEGAIHSFTNNTALSGEGEMTEVWDTVRSGLASVPKKVRLAGCGVALSTTRKDHSCRCLHRTMAIHPTTL